MVGSFGNYQCVIRLSGRTIIGIGHTTNEARRNAMDAIEDRNPDLAGFCAVMKTSLATEPAGYDRRLAR